MSATALLWLRNDLRLADNPALDHLHRAGTTIIPVFIWAPHEEDPWQPGAASRCWLYTSLARLDESLRAAGSRLILRRADTSQSSLEILQDLARQCGAAEIAWNRRYEPAIIERDKRLKQALRDAGTQAESFNANLLFEPWQVTNLQGLPYKVFTPFWKRCLSLAEPPAPLPAPEKMLAPQRWPDSLKLDELELLPTMDWAAGIRESWRPGESGAWHNLEDFCERAVHNYPAGRDMPAAQETSRLSPHLHFGEIGPRQIWHRLQQLGLTSRRQGIQKGIDKYLAEIGWREFGHHLLFHFPSTAQTPLRPEFERFPWRDDPQQLRAWQQGKTGYPIVDAGMRELWHSGWMHNRVRMVVASFLVKHLLLPWQAGAAWFWDTLVDADLASNTLGWQWSAGCGADAAPYFRIFNPIMQGERFDAQGQYVRRWVPELAGLPEKFLHQPWAAPADLLRNAGVKLGENYPLPIVEHAQARDTALRAYASLNAKNRKTG